MLECSPWVLRKPEDLMLLYNLVVPTLRDFNCSLPVSKTSGHAAARDLKCNLFFIRAANLSKLLSAPLWKVRQSHFSAQGLHLFPPQCFQHHRYYCIDITRYYCIYCAIHLSMHIHAYTCSPSLNHLVIPDTLHHFIIQESKEGKDKELYGFILIKHSLITWFHCCNISIISLYWIIQNVFLNKHTSSIPTCEERQAGVQTYFRQQAPAGITHLFTTHSYKTAGCASLERLGSCCFYLNWIGSKGLEAIQAKAALWSIGSRDIERKRYCGCQ